MIKNFKKGSLLLIVAFALVSCTTWKSTYRYGNVTYEQPEPALAAQKAELDAIVARIPPTDHPVGGSAVVIVPSVSAIMKTIIWKGPEPSQEQKETSMRFTATSLVNGFRGRGEAIRKRRIFDRVVMTESDSPENATFSEDIAILLIVKKSEPGWFVKKARGKETVQTEIEGISTALPPVQREILWLDRVEKASRRD